MNDLRRNMKILPFLLTLLIGASTAPLTHGALPKEDVIDVPAIGEGLCLHNLFQSNMVLQRGKPIAVWGWATPGEKVTVAFAGQSKTATAGKDRAWKVTLDALEANDKPAELVVKGKSDTLTLNNILVGDVWILGGQSNMEHPLSRVENGQLEIVSANYPEIRILTVPYGNGADAEYGFPRLQEYSSWFGRHFRKGYWEVSSPDTVRELSAIGFVFARRLHTASDVPIGVVDVSRGGTTVETWTPQPQIRKIDNASTKALMAKWDDDIANWDAKADLAQRIEKQKQYLERMKKEGKPVPDNRKGLPTDLRPGPIGNHNMPGACYNGMIAPISGFSVKGTIFHQGYNNCFNGTEGARMYRAVFPEMIKAWRAAFNDPEMPFAILSLCTQGKAQEFDDFTSHMLDAGPFIREAQYQTYLELLNAGDKNIGFVSTYDLQRRWYHPQLKAPAGERAARWALATQYGKNLDWQPAIIKEMAAGDGKITLTFDRSVGALDNGLPLRGFAIAGKDRRFHPAEASYFVKGKDSRGRDQLDKTRVILTSPLVPEPVAYRFAWARMPLANAMAINGTSDIPLATQRSDDWPLEMTPLLEEFKDNPPTGWDRGIRGKLMQELKKIDLERRLYEAEQLLKEHNKSVADAQGE